MATLRKLPMIMEKMATAAKSNDVELNRVWIIDINKPMLNSLTHLKYRKVHSNY